MFKHDMDDVCLFCLHELTISHVMVLDCGHTFHEKCLLQYLFTQYRRESLVSYDCIICKRHSDILQSKQKKPRNRLTSIVKFISDKLYWWRH